MINDIHRQHQKLQNHPLYQNLGHLTSLRIFMKYHVFAVYDFMSLLKSLQARVCPSIVPWRPSKFSPKIIRFINEIVLGEESDLDHKGRPKSHFQLYLEAMDEVGADRTWIDEFLKKGQIPKMPQAIIDFLTSHLHQAQNLSNIEVAGSFLFGREQLVPIMFSEIITFLDPWRDHYPALFYYFKRHIEVDSEHHGPLSKEIFYELGQNNRLKLDLGYQAALKSCSLRYTLWDAALNEIKQKGPGLRLLKSRPDQSI